MKKVCSKKSCSSKQSGQHFFCLRHALERNFKSLLSTERNSEHFSPLRNGSNGIPRVFCSAEWFRTEFREFAYIFAQNSENFLLCGMVRNSEFREFSVPQNSRNSAKTNQLFRLFRLQRINFFVGNCQPYLYCHALRPSF
jgi:hypothetical protein